MTKPTALPLWDTNETSTTDPGATRKSDGWLVPAGVPEKPPYQVFNHWQNNVYKWLKYTEEQGITEWDSTITYSIGAYVVASDKKLYRALVSQSGNTPVGDPTNWLPVGDLLDILTSTDTTRGLTAAQGKILSDNVSNTYRMIIERWAAIDNKLSPASTIYAFASSLSLKQIILTASNGQGAVSTDGINWRLIDDTTFTTDRIRGAVWNENVGLYVIVGNAGKGATSPDGINWTSRTMNMGTSVIHWVASDESAPLFVAVGSGNTGATSPDGINWTSRTMVHTGLIIYSIVKGTGSGDSAYWVAVSSGGIGSRSANGISWALIGNMQFGTDNIFFVCYSKKLNLYVAVGQNGKGSYSDDSINWEVIGNMQFGTSSIYAVTYSEEIGIFVATGASGKASYSVDGKIWYVIENSNLSITKVIYGLYYSHYTGSFFVGNDNSETATTNIVPAQDCIIDKNDDLILSVAAYQIGSWNMDISATRQVTVALPTSQSKIISITVIIHADDFDQIYPLDYSTSGANVAGSWYYNDSVTPTFYLERFVGGFFDDPLFDSTTINRGWIYVTYYD